MRMFKVQYRDKGGEVEQVGTYISEDTAEQVIKREIEADKQFWPKYPQRNRQNRNSYWITEIILKERC
jgi:hypothetical protein